MQIKLHTIFFFLILANLSSFSQDKRHSVVDQYLSEDFQLIGEVDSEIRGCINPIVERRLINTLKDSASFYYPFDSLSNYVQIIQSDDEQLKLFTWDMLDGGSWHHIVGHAQFKSAKGKVHYQSLYNEKVYESGDFTDVIIYDIQTIKIDSIIYYLTTGWGTHGSGMHHATIQVFQILDKSLVAAQSFFIGKPYYAVEGLRKSKIDLRYNPETKTISHNEFLLNEEKYDGFKTPTGQKVILKLIGERFVKQ